MKWIWSRLTGMWKVMHSPETAFSEDLTGPSYLVPFFVLGLLSVAIAAVQSPIYLEWVRTQINAAGTSQDQAAASIDLVRRSAAAGLLATPVFLIVRWLVHALLIWLITQLLLMRLGFSQALTVVAYSYIPVLVRDAIVCLILCLREPEALMTAEGLHVALGLNLLFPKIPMPWWALAANLNLFELWFVFLLVIGIAKMARTRWQKALAAVLPVWLSVILLQFGLVALGYQVKSQFVRG